MPMPTMPGYPGEEAQNAFSAELREKAHDIPSDRVAPYLMLASFETALSITHSGLDAYLPDVIKMRKIIDTERHNEGAFDLRRNEMNAMYMEDLFRDSDLVRYYPEHNTYEMTDSGAIFLLRVLDEHEKNEDPYITEILDRVSK